LDAELRQDDARQAWHYAVGLIMLENEDTKTAKVEREDLPDVDTRAKRGGMLKVTAQQMTARAEALEDAAGHLMLDWTDDETEREQGHILSANWIQEAHVWRIRAENAGVSAFQEPETGPRGRTKTFRGLYEDGYREGVTFVMMAFLMAVMMTLVLRRVFECSV